MTQKIPRFLTAVTDSYIVLVVLWQWHEMLQAGIHRIRQYHTMKPDALIDWGKTPALGIFYPAVTWYASTQLLGSVSLSPDLQYPTHGAAWLLLKQTCVETGKKVQKQIQAIQEIQLLNCSYTRAHLEAAHSWTDYQRELQLYGQVKKTLDT